MAACNEHGVDLYEAGKSEQALIPLKTACAGDLPRGCTNLGIGQNTLAAPDYTGAIASFTRACELGHATGCSELGSAFIDRQAHIDLEAARKFKDKACELGSMDGCSDFGMLLARGEGGPADMDRAVQLFQKACAADVASGCGRLGLSYQHGFGGLPKDLTKAKELFDQGCKGGDEEACANQKGP